MILDRPGTKLTLSAVRERLRGAWRGRLAAYRRPFAAEPPDPPPPPPDPSPESIRLEAGFLEVLVREGPRPDRAAAAAPLAAAAFPLSHAAASARDLLRRGLPPQLCGHPDHNPHADDADFQSAAAVFGLASPALPRAARRLAETFGGALAYGDGQYGGVFVAGLYAGAFVQDDPERLVRSAMEPLPEASGLAAAIREVLDAHRERPGDWREARRRLEAGHSDNDACPEGWTVPANRDARLNAGFAVLALLYGEGDFRRTVGIALACGREARANAAIAGGLVGAMRGPAAIPAGGAEGEDDFDDPSPPGGPPPTEALVESCVRAARENLRDAYGSFEALRGGEEIWNIPVMAPDGPAELRVTSIPVVRPPGSVEIEAGTPPATIRGGVWRFQPWYRVTPNLRGGGRLLFEGEGPGSGVVLRLPVTIPDRYDAAVIFSRGPSYGRVRVRFDGAPAGGEFDGWAPRPVWMAEHPLGTLVLRRGIHRVEFDVSGRHPESTGFDFAADVLLLRPAGPRVPRWRLRRAPEGSGDESGPAGDLVESGTDGFADPVRIFPVGAAPVVAEAQVRCPDARDALLEAEAGRRMEISIGGALVGEAIPPDGPGTGRLLKPVRLQEGWNRVRLRMEGPSPFRLRLSDPGGELEWRADPPSEGGGNGPMDE